MLRSAATRGVKPGAVTLAIHSSNTLSRTAVSVVVAAVAAVVAPVVMTLIVVTVAAALGAALGVATVAHANPLALFPAIPTPNLVATFAAHATRLVVNVIANVITDAAVAHARAFILLLLVVVVV